MALRTFLRTLGAGAPSVDTVVTTARVQPGAPLQCEVTVRGGGADLDVERLRLELVVRAEDLEPDGSTGWTNPYVVTEATVGPFRLPEGETVVRRIALDVPWEMPLTHERGLKLSGSRVAVRTELAVDSAADKGDFDEIEVHALPSQELLFQVFQDLGFRFHESEVKLGKERWPDRMKDRRTAPFWQELDFWFPASWNRGTQELETVLITRPDALDVHPGGYPPVTLPAGELDRDAWRQAVEEHIRSYWA
ncbi:MULTISPECIES: sporulation protein [Streptomyces]|jgi:sporulation-control protein|uniref:sporulation protein n=1 Tax=Streptomyces TaxID=1883 RepID=UPI000A364407|nr:sporulation protein [Streptomyces glaucescens]